MLSKLNYKQYNSTKIIKSNKKIYEDKYYQISIYKILKFTSQIAKYLKALYYEMSALFILFK